MLLTILIPTYNRSKPLVRNVSMLCGFIRKNGLTDLVAISVSDNRSTDDTDAALRECVSANGDIAISQFRQSANTGLEHNALTLLKNATTDYVMYIGDDDYIAEPYLTAVVRTLTQATPIACVLPSYRASKEDGEVSEERDTRLRSKLYKPSFASCLENSWRGHQLSGVVLRRKGLYEEYLTRGVNNIYPFVFFVAYSSLHGTLWHLTDYPVLVSELAQSQKDWGYKDDGLVSQFFDNYRCLYRRPFQVCQRSLLELRLLRRHSWRYLMYLRQGKSEFFRATLRIAETSSWPTKICFIWGVLPGLFIRAVVRRCLPSSVLAWKRRRWQQ